MSSGPFSTLLKASGDRLDPTGSYVEYRLSELDGTAADPVAFRQLVAASDPLVYSVAVSRVPAVSGEIGFALTSIRPGTIGDEFFMTRGHVHERPEGEVYFCLSGAGGVLLRRDASVRWIEMAPQHVVSIPPGWAHRTVNVGSDPFRFLAAYPADLSNDYRSVRVAGIGARVVRSGPEYRVLDDDGGELPSHGE